MCNFIARKRRVPVDEEGVSFFSFSERGLRLEDKRFSYVNFATHKANKFKWNHKDQFLGKNEAICVRPLPFFITLASPK